jgi:hypothetical protein
MSASNLYGNLWMIGAGKITYGAMLLFVEEKVG